MAMIREGMLPRSQRRLLLIVRSVFHIPGCKDTLTTTAKITGSKRAKTLGFSGISISENMRRLCEHGRLKEALSILHVRDHREIQLDSDTCAALVQECIRNKALRDGKLIHALMVDTGFNTDTFLVSKLVIMYAKCGSLMDARLLFEKMPERNVVLWTAMIGSYVRHGYNKEALTLYYQMQREGIPPNEFTFAAVLPACANLAALEHGKSVHEDVARSGLQSDIFVESALVDMYAKCGTTDDARNVFDKMPERNIISWTAMISGYARNGQIDDAMKFFAIMPRRNAVSWTAVIAGYARNGAINDALKLFQKMPERDGVSWNAMIAGYVQNGHVEEAQKLLERMSEQNVVSSNAMIAGYAQNGQVAQALNLFKNMPERPAVSWTAMIAAYAQNGQIDEALKFFQKMSGRDTISWNAMIAGYAKNGHIDESWKLFQKMPEQDTVSWNAIMAGYAQNGHIEEALKIFQKMSERDVVSWNAMVTGHMRNGHRDEVLKLFWQMQQTAVKPDSITFTSVLLACADLAALIYGKQVHEIIIRSGFQSYISDMLRMGTLNKL